MGTSNQLNIQTLHIKEDERDMVVDHEDIKNNAGLEKLQVYAKSLPYSIESNAKMQSLLDFYLMRFVQVSIIFII